MFLGVLLCLHEELVPWCVTVFTRAAEYSAAGKEDGPSSRRVLEFQGVTGSCRAATLDIKLCRDSDPCRHWCP